MNRIVRGESQRFGSDPHRRTTAVRSEPAVHLVSCHGLSPAEAARLLGVSTSGIAKAVERAERPSVH